MNIVIKNVDIVTLDSSGNILLNSNICISGKRIVAVGGIPKDFCESETIDARNHVAVPGFFNAHCHAPMTFERGWAEDLPLDRWFNERIWVAESALTSDDVYWGAALAACEMIQSGCVAFNDHYFYMDRVAEVIAQSGMKGALAWCQFGIGADKEVGTDLGGTLKFIETWQGKADGRVKTVMGPHSPYVCPPEFLKEISLIARDHSIPTHIHLSESQEQVETSRKKYGKTPTEHLRDCGIFDVPCVAAHAIYMTSEDISILAQHNVTVAHCPITYMKLSMGVNDLSHLLSAGVNVALGTDGPGSNSDMDMKAAIRFTPLLQKFHTRNAEAIPGDLPLRMASQNGAKALGFDNSGSLEPGKAADIALFDFDQPHLYPRHNLVANLVHSARGSDVSFVFIDGRLVFRKGEFLTMDAEKIRAEAESHAKIMINKNLHIMRKYEG